MNPPLVYIVERRAPEEDIEIVICRSQAEAAEAIAIAARLGLEIWAAESYPFAAQFAEFKEAHADTL